MDEVIVEGLDYEDFVALKTILTECTSFTNHQQKDFVNSTVLLEKIEKIIQVFKE